jgi:type VI protein secretion system component VasK
MKAALKFSLFVAVLVSAVALGGSAYALAGIFNAGPVMRRDDYLQLQHLFHTWALYSVVGLGITIWLWWTYRREYGNT